MIRWLSCVQMGIGGQNNCFFGRLGGGNQTLSFESVKFRVDSIAYHRFSNFMDTLNVSIMGC
jgi:hypothetical protein